MESTTLHIKNMVCRRCIKAVEEEFIKLGLVINLIELGKVEIQNQITDSDLINIKEVLSKNGFELIDDKNSRIINQIKTIIIELIHHQKEKSEHLNFSDFLSKELGFGYSYLSKLFSSVEGTTIEKYFAHQKTEKVKELLVYDELSLSEIAFRLDYSSVQHLSSQFKRITGFSPSYFKKLKNKPRNPLDLI